MTNMRSTLARAPRWHAGVMAAIAGLILMVSAPLQAQTDPGPTDTTITPGPALREGNVWGHQDHQPTAADVGASLSRETDTDVEKEVQQLLKQTDELDRKLDQDEESR